MRDLIIQFFSEWPAEVATFVLAMLPITELRGSIPVAISVFGLEPAAAFLWSVAGNIIPLVILVYLLPLIAQVCERHLPLCDRLLKWIFARTERKLRGRYEKYGALALLIFVSIPLPFTGVWTGAIAAYLFNISKRYSIPALVVGMLIAGILVTLISTGIIETFQFLL